MGRFAVRAVVTALVVGGVVAATYGAYRWGDYLLGSVHGALCALITLGLAWLLIRSCWLVRRVSGLRLVFVVVLGMFLGYVFFFPDSFDPSIRRYIELQTIDRRAQAALNDLFDSEPEFRNLTVSSVHTDILTLTIHGSLPTLRDHDRLTLRIKQECQGALEECYLMEDIRFENAAKSSPPKPRR